ncbi:subtilisin-like protein [Backusella circina FSU 941]|nr:subtilisin-like protein [Backusella circina FSU 941]
MQFKALFLLLVPGFVLDTCFANTLPSILEDLQKLSLDPEPHRFTVRFQSDCRNQSAVYEEQNAFLDHLRNENINFSIRYRFTDIMNAISLEIYQNSSQQDTLNQQSKPKTNLSFHGFKPSRFVADSVQSLPYVKEYWRGKKYKRPQTYSPSQYNSTTVYINDREKPNLYCAHDMTGVSEVKKDGITGKGIKIGILDTGIDYTHPALGGCFGEGCLVRYGYDLVGDLYGEKNPKTQPDDDPMDGCDGHGTHIAGIIAANDTHVGFEGVSPGVELGAWRIFGCDGYTDDDIILSAVEMAVKAGMNIINLSLGDGLGSWEEDSLAVALSSIVDRGVAVIVAQGNEGDDGIMRTPSPSTGSHVLTVGSVDNTRKWTHKFRVLHPKTKKAHVFEYRTPTENNPDFGLSGTLTALLKKSKKNNKMVYRYSKTACRQINDNLSGYIVLIERGGCPFGKKAMNLQKAGAAGVIFFSDKKSSELRSISIKGYSEINIPLGSITRRHGRKIINLLSSVGRKDAKLKMEFHKAMSSVHTGGQVSSFSSWGSDPELHFKPDISAIGGSIYSTYPMDLGGYATMSGTSMATVSFQVTHFPPYVAGCIALYMQATGNHSPMKAFQSIINHAKPIQAHASNLKESPLKQGSGLVQIDQAIKSYSSVEPFKLALNDTEFFNSSVSVKVYNKSNYTMNYAIEYHPAIAVSGFNFSESSVPVEKPSLIESNATITFSHKNFSLGCNETKDINVKFVHPSADIEHPHAIYGGYVNILVKSGSDSSSFEETMNVPFFGSVGKQRDLPIFDTMRGYPYIDTRSDLEFHEYEPSRIASKKYKATTDISFDFEKGDSLCLYNRIGSPTAEIKTELQDLNNKTIGKLWQLQEQWVPRHDNSMENYRKKYIWKGMIESSQGPKQVSTGSYKIKLSALKIYGDKDLEDDWETWKSPNINIQGYTAKNP